MTRAKNRSVGLFWGLPEPAGGFRLLFVTVELSQADRYGECLTDERGHQEVWDRWCGLSPRELKACGIPVLIKTRPYDHWPRGRVVYKIPQERFAIYADPRLHGAQTVRMIKTGFGLRGQRVSVRSDDHYRTRAV